MRTPPPARRALSSRTPAVVVAVLVLASACSRHSDEDEGLRRDQISFQRRSAASPADSLRAGDVRIVTTDSAVDLALLGDSISAGLSAKTLEKVRRETDTATITGSGFGASIERLVKGSVAGAIGTRVAIPLSEVRDVRYERGELRFDWAGKPVHLFEEAKVNGRPVMQSFRAEDARRFAEAVRARKAGRPATP